MEAAKTAKITSRRNAHRAPEKLLTFTRNIETAHVKISDLHIEQRMFEPKFNGREFLKEITLGKILFS